MQTSLAAELGPLRAVHGVRAPSSPRTPKLAANTKRRPGPLASAPEPRLRSFVPPGERSEAPPLNEAFSESFSGKRREPAAVVLIIAAVCGVKGRRGQRASRDTRPRAGRAGQRSRECVIPSGSPKSGRLSLPRRPHLARTSRRVAGRPAPSAGTARTFFPSLPPPRGWTRPPRGWRRSWTSSARDNYLALASCYGRFCAFSVVSGERRLRKPPTAREISRFGNPKKPQVRVGQNC